MSIKDDAQRFAESGLWDGSPKYFRDKTALFNFDQLVRFCESAAKEGYEAGANELLDEIEKLKKVVLSNANNGLSGIGVGIKAVEQVEALKEENQRLREALEKAKYWMPCGYEIQHEDPEMNERLIEDNKFIKAALERKE